MPVVRAGNQLVLTLLIESPTADPIPDRVCPLQIDRLRQVSVRNARDAKWKKLVQEIQALPETHPDALAFQLMMVRLNSCVTCDARKYVEKGGCARCSNTTLSFSKDSEEALLARFRAARKEIAQALKEQNRELEQAA